jgi:hypothetical protein
VILYLRHGSLVILGPVLIQARHGPSRSFPLGEHYEIGIRSELQMLLIRYRLPFFDGPCT